MRKTLLALMVVSSFGAIALPAQADVDVILNFGPPPVRYERVPSPRPGFVWESGHWRWNGNRHVWVSGHWVSDRDGYVYYGPRWVERNGSWHYQTRRWDRDGDGVANRFDSHPDNPYRN